MGSAKLLSLLEARQRANELRKAVKIDRRDVLAERKDEAAAKVTLREAARQYHVENAAGWKSAIYARQWLASASRASQLCLLQSVASCRRIRSVPKRKKWAGSGRLGKRLVRKRALPEQSPVAARWGGAQQRLEPISQRLTVSDNDRAFRRRQ